MIFQTTLSNKTHPEYGVATVPFPIPCDHYDHTIELLESMCIGNATVQDCRVDGLDSKYPVLNWLVFQSVNAQLEDVPGTFHGFDFFTGKEISRAMVQKRLRALRQAFRL